MKNDRTSNVWAVSLFAVGFLIFNPPLIRIFTPVHGQLVFGFPVFFACVFIAWLILIALMITLSKRIQAKSAMTLEKQQSGKD